MALTHIIIGIILAIILLELVKNLFFKKSSKFLTIVIILVIVFLAFSYTFKNAETFKDNEFVQTGAAIAGDFVGFFEEKVDTWDPGAGLSRLLASGWPAAGKGDKPRAVSVIIDS